MGGGREGEFCPQPEKVVLCFRPSAIITQEYVNFCPDLDNPVQPDLSRSKKLSRVSIDGQLFGWKTIKEIQADDAEVDNGKPPPLNVIRT